MIPVRLMAWIKRFVDPIILPDGRELLTLRDAAEYITRTAEGRALCCLSPERDGPEMLARLAVLKALNRHRPNAPSEPRRKPAKVFRIVR
jgi:hypothetical protein